MRKILQGVSGLLIMLALATAVIWLVQNAPNSSQELSTQISPLPTTTIEITEATPTGNLTFTPTTLPTVSMVVDVTSTPLPVPTIQPEKTSSPTPKPLSPLNKSLQTIIFTAGSEQGPQIYRMQVDETGQKAGPVEQIEFSTAPRMQILSLFPSPDGQRVAVGWVIGTGTTHVSILDVASGQLRPLFGEAEIDQRVTFLAWSPDSQNVLVMGGTANPDLGNSAWLVDVNTHQYRDVNIKQVNEIPYIYDATFSPDGRMIVYTHSHINGEIWRLNLENSEQQLLYKTEAGILDVSWSPNGEFITFTQWHKDETFPVGDFIIGELHLMNADGSEEHVLSSLVIHSKNQVFHPTWSPDSRQIAFVKSENLESERQLEQFNSNIYTFDIINNQLDQLTDYRDAKVIKPVWNPDGDQVAFLIGEQGLESPFHLQTITTIRREIRDIDTTINTLSDDASEIQSGSLNIQSYISWLP